MHSANADGLTERTRKKNRDLIHDSMIARTPVSSGARRFSEGKFGGQPQSHHGERPMSGRSLDSPVPPNNTAQTSQHRPHSNQRPFQDGSHLLRRHTTEDLISSNEHKFSGSNASFVPRPPSRHFAGIEGRPKSARGRVRPTSQPGRETKASRENLQRVGEQVPFPPLKSQSSFSKYKPLPSIGTGLVVEPDGDHPSHHSRIKSKHDNDNDNLMLLQKTADLSLYYTLPDEPKDTEPQRIHLAIRLLDGSRHERWFRHTDTLGTVLAFAESASKNKLPPCQFCTNEVPRRVFDNFSESLIQAGITSRTVLYLEDIV